MTRERLEELIDTEKSRTTGDGAFKGLLLLAQYFDVNKTDIITAAEHDEIYSVSVDELLKSGISELDVQSLARSGWGIDTETDSLYHFV